MRKSIQTLSLALMTCSIAFGTAYASTSHSAHRSVVVRVFYKGGIQESFWRSERASETTLHFDKMTSYIKEAKRMASSGGKPSVKLIPGSVRTGVDGVLTHMANGEERVSLHVRYLVRMNKVVSDGMTTESPVIRTLTAQGILYRHRFESENGKLAILVATTSH